MSIIDGPFALYLERHRARCNARFAQLGGRVSPQNAYSVIRQMVAPLLTDVPSEQLTKVSHCLMDSAFSLLKSGLIGADSRSTVINHLWSEGLPRLKSFMLDDPNRLVSAMTNAVFRLEQISEQAAHQWLEEVLDLSIHCVDLNSLLKVGQVLAWTNGQIEYRYSAIEVWKSLPTKLQQVTLGTKDPQWENRWIHPKLDSSTEVLLKLVGCIGGHIDLGGIFKDPPMVGTVNGTIVAFDSNRYFTVFADCFGVQCRPHSDEPDLEVPELPSDAIVMKNGTIKWGLESLKVPQLAHPTSVAFAKDTLMVTGDHSFFVFIFARIIQ